jgi:hypothetical protein
MKLALLLALALCSCVSETPQGSSSSNFLKCKRDADCLDYGPSASCSDELICVDSSGDPIMKDADGAEQAASGTCSPLAAWSPEEFSAPSEGLVWQTPDGAQLAITQLGEDWLVWSAKGGRLTAQHALTDADDSESLTLNVTAEASFSVRLTPAEKPTSAVLITAADDAGTEEIALVKVDGDTLAGLDVVPPQIPARVWARYGVSGDRSYVVEGENGKLPGQLVVVGPAWGGSGNADLRLYYGTEFPLLERPIESIKIAANESSIDVRFRVDDAVARFNQADGNSLSISGDVHSLPSRSTSSRALAELSFSCGDEYDGAFRLSKSVPAALPEASCGSALNHEVGLYPPADADGIGETPLDFTTHVMAVGNSLDDSSEVCSQVGDSNCSRNFILFDRDGTDFWLFIDAPEYTAPLKVDDVVQVKGLWSPGSFGGPYWDIALYTGDGLRAWFKRGRMSLDEPAKIDGLQLRTGDELCLMDEFECTYDASQFALSAALPGAEPAQIPIGTTKAIGAYNVTNLAFEIGLGGQIPGCFDAPTENVQFVVLPR